MSEKNSSALSPSGFYRLRRPEYFSDSVSVEALCLPKEILSFELDSIAANQKQDLFESFCRRLAEKFISPNLIPQVGPTGGGDGKTDTETYPVSSFISERWFIPQNGWDKDEKWAFAISAKKDWKSKAKSDIEKIVGTGRGYTHIYFMTNQLLSSKKKKDAQDEWIENYKINIIILDREWLLEKVYNSNLQDIAINTLNLSSLYSSKSHQVGPNDSIRLKMLADIEEKIANPDRYFEYDHQLVEDALEAAVITRMLEKSREEVEGKFDRALRLAQKINDRKQLLRIYYQRAWTLINWYDDYAGFANEYKNFKGLIGPSTTIAEIELYQNLFNLLSSIVFGVEFNMKSQGIDFKIESSNLDAILKTIEADISKPCSSIMAKTIRAIHGLLACPRVPDSDPNPFLTTLQECITLSSGMLDYPFDTYKRSIEVLGASLADNHEYDKLVDRIADISEKRNSELTAGSTFLARAWQKYSAKLYKDGIIYFGKAVMKVAKEETQNYLFSALVGLAYCYREMGLSWAEYNCNLAAASISFNSWYRTHELNPRAYPSIVRLVNNELMIGRIPSFLNWYEILTVISPMVDTTKYEEDPPSTTMDDILLSCRILNSGKDNISLPEDLPDLFKSKGLLFSRDAALYMLGYIDILLEENKELGITDEKGLDEYFLKMADQPFREQMLYPTNYLNGNKSILYSVILGCKFEMHFENEKDLLLTAEMLLVFFETFMATLLSGVYPTRETIVIHLHQGNGSGFINGRQRSDTSGYDVQVNTTMYDDQHTRGDSWTSIFAFMSMILYQNFVFEKIQQQVETLFREEELDERMSFIFDHRKFTQNILGNDLKLFYRDFISGKTYHAYPIKRNQPVEFNYTNIGEEKKIHIKPDEQKTGHNKRKVSSLINNQFWDQAKWQGFGFFYTESIDFGIFLGFHDGNAGKSIFDEWIKHFGQDDKQDQIRISIIRKINIEHPFWYRVIISSKPELSNMEENQLLFLAARIHTINAEKPDNLDMIVNTFTKRKQYMLFPAIMNEEGTDFKPFTDNGILKRTLIVRDAWEIGEHDLDMVAIFKDDTPIIPFGITDVPILKLLKRKKNEN